MMGKLPDELGIWLESQVEVDEFSIEALVPEASTREFWRLQSTTNSYILMRSPPATENNEQFISLSEFFRSSRVPVPEVYAKNTREGYLLVEDVGRTEFLQIYPTSRRDFAVRAALECLRNIQQSYDPRIPTYTKERFTNEIEIFTDWTCGGLLNVSAVPIDGLKRRLVEIIDALPKVVVHRDFHSRNLLMHEDERIGLVDFQDALIGPLVYDLASLLHDCYFEFDDAEIDKYLSVYLDLVANSTIPQLAVGELKESVELVAIQRQLKAVGIFCRLWFTQNKPSHCKYVVPVLRRVAHLASRHTLTQETARWLEADIIEQTLVALQKLKVPL